MYIVSQMTRVHLEKCIQFCASSIKVFFSSKTRAYVFWSFTIQIDIESILRFACDANIEILMAFLFDKNLWYINGSLNGSC